MPETALGAAAGLSNDAAHGLVAESRFDPPHIMGSGPPSGDNPSHEESLLVEPSADALELVRAQVQQLTGHLRTRQQDLDRREAQLNARLSQFDNAARSERLEHSERRQELAAREEELQRSEAALAEQRAQLFAAESRLENSRHQQEQQFADLGQQHEQRQTQLDAVAQRLAQQRAAQQRATERFRAGRRRAELDLRRQRQQIDTRRQASIELVRLLLQGIERRRADLETRDAELMARDQATTGLLHERSVESERIAAVHELRQQRLDEAEAMLSRDQQEFHELRLQLDAQRDEFEAHCGQLQRELDALRHTAETELQEQRETLRRRGEQLDRRRATLEQMQTDLRIVQRETLEMRLATEELVAQLSGSIPPASLTSSIARHRSKLADHFRLATADLAEQRRELDQLRCQLAEQHERLTRQKSEVQSWVRSRQDELEQQAARLVGREQELDWQDEQIAHLKQRWQDERLSYQQEIRRLLGELRRETVAV